jgi:alkanesulfonate monooxygenase SsuD/methylene tetrahydromethanopterin reductase-like flavin-dependent oxidoreductase (luciferase family)
MRESKFENPEISKEQVISALRSAKEAGATADNFASEFPEAFAMLGAWTDQEAEKIGKSAEDQVRFNIARADLYASTGFDDSAEEMLRDSLWYAEGIGDQGLIDMIRIRIYGA